MPSKPVKKRKNKKSRATAAIPNLEERGFRNFPAFEKKVETAKKIMVRENFPDEIWEQLTNRK